MHFGSVRPLIMIMILLFFLIVPGFASGDAAEQDGRAGLAETLPVEEEAVTGDDAVSPAEKECDAPFGETDAADGGDPDPQAADTDEPAAEDTSVSYIAYDGTADVSLIMNSTDIVRMRLQTLRDTYYEGYPWGGSVTYGGGNGCTAFAFKVSDLLFSPLPYSHYYNNGYYSYSNIHAFSFDDIHIGDLIFSNKYPNNVVTDSHVSVVLDKTDDYITVVEGNWLEKVHWDRKITRKDLEGYRALWTRYPDHMTGDVSGDKCIDAYDAAALLRGIVFRDLSAIDTYAADMDGDQSLTPADPASILMLSAMKEDGMLWRVIGE